MKKALMFAPMGSVHRRFNTANIKALQSLGFEVHLLANFESGDGPEKQNPDFAARCAENGIAVHSLPYRRHSLLRNRSLIRPTAELIKTGGFSLVHAHTETGGLVLRLAGKSAPDMKYFYTPHGMSFYRGSSLKTQLIYRPVERWICSGMDCNIAINREEYSVLTGWDPDTAAFVHGIGLNTERFLTPGRDRASVRRELGIPADAPLILSIGELDDNKNHRIVIEAMAEMKREDVYYVICGVGPRKETLLALAAERGLAGRVVLAGYRSDIPDMIHAADIFAFPSFHEGMPVSLLEAMAGGLPAVGSAIRGIVDLIEDGVNGFLASPPDKEAWKTKMLRLLADADLRRDFSEKSRNTVQSYSLAEVEKELASLYGAGDTK